MADKSTELSYVRYTVGIEKNSAVIRGDEPTVVVVIIDRLAKPASVELVRELRAPYAYVEYVPWLENLKQSISILFPDAKFYGE